MQIMNDIYFTPKEIVFERNQVLWLLFNLPLLKEGMWPPNPYVSGYTDEPMGKSKRYKRAYFETPVQFAAEISFRLDKTGIDGKLLLAQVMGFDRVTVEDLQEEAHYALNYISGWKRKRMEYKAWRRQRVYYENVVIRGRKRG